MAKRNEMSLDLSGFEAILRKIEVMGGDIEQITEEALGQAAETIKADTMDAMTPANMPAGGTYWSGDTKEAVVQDTSVRWEGGTAWVPVGFDFDKPGAGGYLIKGTPKMKPVPQLNKMFKAKRYMNQIQKDMEEVILGHLTDEFEKGG